jgi:hypothetical protein
MSLNTPRLTRGIFACHHIILEYIDEGDYRAQKCWIVYGITGSFHDGTWVQARRRDITRSLYHDGPFKDADIDTLFLPHTISEIGDGAFENGKIKVLVIGAQTPPKFNTGDNTPALGAKLSYQRDVLMLTKHTKPGASSHK